LLLERNKEAIMRGTVAKQIRRQVYGTLDFRERKYRIIKHRVKVFDEGKIIWEIRQQVMADEKRRQYQTEKLMA